MQNSGSQIGDLGPLDDVLTAIGGVLAADHRAFGEEDSVVAMAARLPGEELQVGLLVRIDPLNPRQVG